MINKNTVPVNRIIPFSAVDGPGNRTAIFLQGCNLDCKYCHNPETRALCRHCGACVVKCPTGALRTVSDCTEMKGNVPELSAFPEMSEKATGSKVVFDPAKCVGCDTCIQTCVYDASPRIHWMSADEVVAEVKKQIPYIRGITVSGGECMLYPEFLTELFKKCRALGLHTLIDSNGMVDFVQYPELLEVSDGVMLDIKAFSTKDHIEVTGSANSMILQNVVFLANAGKLFEIRTVVVRELFDPAEVITSIAEYLRPIIDIGRLRYKLIAYRPFGVRRQYQIYESPDEAYMHQLRLVALQAGFKDVILI